MIMKIIRFIKDWTLIIAILTGIAAYFVYTAIPALQPTHDFTLKTIEVLQPLLIFAMLFITFCKVNPKKLRLCKWHPWLLLFQAGTFTAIAVALMIMPKSGLRIVLEGAMICLICPTATAGAVITKKLGGNVNHITTYTILINIITAIFIPALVPYVHPNPDLGIINSAVLILGKVFPLLLLPLLAAILLRYLSPRLHFMISHFSELSFYLWAVALTLAMTVTTRTIVHADVALTTGLGLVAASLISCLLQFWLGRKVGGIYNDRITGGQSLGQKNTVLAIWMGYTFFTPITAVAGGFYSIWHNVINSYQLYQHRKKEEEKKGK